MVRHVAEGFLARDSALDFAAGFVVSAQFDELVCEVVANAPSDLRSPTSTWISTA